VSGNSAAFSLGVCMTLVKYLRPSGTTIEVNDTAETRALAESAGWTAVKPSKISEAVKKVTPKKSK
jgi:hypothetical protein